MVVDATVEEVVGFDLFLESVNVLALCTKTGEESVPDVSLNRWHCVQGFVVGEALEGLELIAWKGVLRNVEGAHVASEAGGTETKLARVLDRLVREVQAVHHVMAGHAADDSFRGVTEDYV